MELESIQSGMNVCYLFSCNHWPLEARIERYTHNDPIMLAVRSTQDKCASVDCNITATDGAKRFLKVWLMKSEKSGNLISRKTHGHCQEHCSLTAPLFGKVVKKWTNSGPGRDPLLLLATDATPEGYGKHRHGVPQTSTANKLTGSGLIL